MGPKRNRKRKGKKKVSSVGKPFVSVCTPTYNRRRFLPFLIKCFEAQTYPRELMEWIIVDDGEDNVGDIFSDKQIKGIEDHVPVNQSEVEWEMDDYTRQRLEELGLGDDPEEDYISYK